MGMKILNSYRLSDFYEYVDETLDIYSKTIKVKMLKNINISDYTSSKGLKKLPKATKNAIVSSIACTNNILTEEEKKDLGIFVGMSLSYIEHGLQFMSPAYESSPRLVSPLMFPNTVLNSISGWISIVLGSKSINTTINTGQNSGIDALKVALEFLHSKAINKALVVVTEEIAKSVVESDLLSSNYYMEDTFALLLTLDNDDEQNFNYEIEEIYSKYVTKDKFLQHIMVIDEDFPDEEKNAIYGFWKEDIVRNADYYFVNDINMLSCTSINQFFHCIQDNKYDNIIISENNKSGMFSYLKVRKNVRKVKNE